MMQQFSRKKKSLPGRRGSFSHQVLKLKSKVSIWLNWHCRKLSAKALLTALIIFCVTWTVLLIRLIFRGA